MVDTFPKNFLKSIKTKECLLFIGSGISSWSGLPTWEGLLISMINFLSDRGLILDEKQEIESIIRKGDLLTAASLCSSRMRRADLRDFVDDVFINPNPQPHEIHEIIVGLGPDSFITTNYDRLIEDAYQRVNESFVLFPVNNDQPIEQAKMLKHGQSHFIFTPHGRVDKVDTIILSREDYRRIQFDSKAVIKSLEHLLISRPIVYLGYGLQDPDFLMIKDQIASTYQGGEREHFAILPDVSNMMKQFWRENYGINIISYSTQIHEVIDKDGHKIEQRTYTELLQLLKKLSQEIKPTPIVLPKKYTDFHETPEIKDAVIRFCRDIEHSYSNNLKQWIQIFASFRIDLSPQMETKAYPRTLPVLELLRHDENLIIIGSPGSGKTFAIQTYAAILAEQALERLRLNNPLNPPSVKNRIPLILPMNEYNGDLAGMIVARLPRSIDVKVALKSGLFVLMFDAIDEISRTLVDTKTFSNDLSSFFSKFPSNRFVFTSRIVGYFSFLPLPVFELQPVTSAELEDYLASFHISQSVLQPELQQKLQNPFILSSFVILLKDLKEKRLNFVSILEYNLHRFTRSIKSKTSIDISLKKLLAPICYDLVNRGSTSLTASEIEQEIEKTLCQTLNSKDFTAVQMLKLIISTGLLVPNAEGRLGFFHKTMIEYLAATELVSRYQQGTFSLAKHINLHNWDETIILFLQLLPPEDAKKILLEITEFDIIFACSTFESATVKDKTIGLFLFDQIAERLSDPVLPIEKKPHLGAALVKLVPFGRKDILKQWLEDDLLAPNAALFLAHMGAKELINRIVSLASEDNSYPSSFAKALVILADEEVVSVLIEQGSRAPDEKRTLDNLLKGFFREDNLAYVIVCFESETLYSKIDRLRRSAIKRERMFAANILSHLDSDRALVALVKMLRDPDYEVCNEVIFRLLGGWDEKTYKTQEIIHQMFQLLKEKQCSSYATRYLIKYSDPTVVSIAKKRIIRAKNRYELINLYAILAKELPDQARRLLFEQLENYEPSLHEDLPSAIARLPVEYILPDILSFLRIDNHDLQETVLKALDNHAGYRKQLPIKKDDALFLLNLWEDWCDSPDRQQVGQLMADHVQSITKPILLERLADPNYRFRNDIIELVARLPLEKGDLSRSVIYWLISKFAISREERSRYFDNPVTKIVGKVSDESLVVEKLVPLLSSSNEAVKNNAYLAVKTAERALGKRFLKE